MLELLIINLVVLDLDSPTTYSTMNLQLVYTYNMYTFTDQKEVFHFHFPACVHGNCDYTARF